MRIEAHKAEYDFEPIGRIDHAIVFTSSPEENPDAVAHTLCQVTLHDMQNLHEGEKTKSLRGLPTMIAWNAFASKILFWPTPDKDTEASISFFGPLKRA